MPDLVHRAIFQGAALFALLLVLAPALSPAAEPPATRPATPVTFLGKAHGEIAILDESSEPYFKLLQPMEMSAKTGKLITGRTIEAEQDECRQRYKQAVLDFTPQEMQAVEALAARISKAAEKSFPLFARTPWSFIKIADGIEGGQPFTRARHIVLPKSFVSQVLRQQSDVVARQQGWLLLIQSGSSLVSCQLLVVRQSHPDAFAQMYQQLWQMVHVDKIEPGPFLTAHQFLTPGAVGQRWVYQIKDDQRALWILPLQILPNAVNPAGLGTERKFVRLEGNPEQGFRPAQAPNGDPVMESLDNLPQFTSQFAPSPQKAFNPDVAAADLFWKILVFEEMLPTPPPEAKNAIAKARLDLAKPREWFERILAP